MKKMFKKITSMILVLATSLSISIPTFAVTNSTNNTNRHYNNNSYMETVEKLTPYIAKNTDGTLYIEAEYKSLDIDSDDCVAILNNLKMVNSMISNGYLVSDAQGNLTVTKKYVSEVQANTNSTNQVTASKNRISVTENSISPNSVVKNSIQANTASTKNVTNIVWTWYGFKLYLNNTLSNRVAAGLGISAAIATLIPDPTLCKAVCVALGVSAGLISFNNSGNGVIINFETLYSPTGLPIPQPIWIKGQ